MVAPLHYSGTLFKTHKIRLLREYGMNAGTGGTIAGISRKLKSKDQGIKVFLVDPPGSGLYNKITRGVMFTRQEAEQKRLKNPFDTITEGVGINRITKNFSQCDFLLLVIRCLVA